MVGDLDLIPLDRAVQDLACDIASPLLRTPDALHLASAVLFGEELTTDSQSLPWTRVSPSPHPAGTFHPRSTEVPRSPSWRAACPLLLLRLDTIPRRTWGADGGLSRHMWPVLRASA